MKRVGCLYRVSSKRQVYENDIPVQRKACEDFIETKSNWMLEKEYIELGVSGYKLSSQKRDALQEIRNDVLNDKIDILLVFLFDRIGRKESETPFVVKWLVDNGIEVWSVNEGQRKIEDQYDRLINFITYWQAEGESEKISVRATERRIQLVKEGVYMGNYAPYGYELIESDIYTKIGKKRKILKINSLEAGVIKKIYDLIINDNYGIDKITVYLNQNNIKRRNKKLLWDNSIILDIVRNPIYKGYVSFGKRYRRNGCEKRIKREKWILAEKPNCDIIIIPEDRWEKANDIIDRRSRKGEKTIRLLTGLTRCGYCNDFICPRGKKKWIYMLCKGKQKTGFCEYTANYRLEKVENIVINEVQNFLKKLKKVNLQDIIIEKIKKTTGNNEKILKIDRQIDNLKIKITELKAEVIETLLSNNQEKQEEISKEIKLKNKNISELQLQKTKLETEIENLNNEISNLKECIPNWEKEFKKTDFDTQRAIINELIDKIYLFNDKIEIHIKYPIKNFILKVGNDD